MGVGEGDVVSLFVVGMGFGRDGARDGAGAVRDDEAR